MSLISWAHDLLLAARRARAIVRIRASARLAGADLDLRVAKTARIGRITVRLDPTGPSQLHIGEHTTLDDGVEIRLRGGSVRIADWVEIRSGVRLMASGTLEALGQNVLSWGMVVHCDESVVLGRRSTFGEYVTVTDSTHEHVEGGWHVDQIRTSPVRVGEDTWVGAKATIGRGVAVGDQCVIAGSAVVVRDVPDHHVALGVPADARPRTR